VPIQAETKPRGTKPQSGWRAWLSRIAPGIVTGASDLDPSAVVTATVVGAAFWFSLLWLVVLCVPFLLAIFSVTGRVGVQTRKGLFDLLRVHYGRKLSIVAAALTITSSMAVIIADLMAVSDAFSIFIDVPRTFLVGAIAFSVWYILIFRDYRRITQALVWLSLPLYLYVLAAILMKPSISQLLWHSFVPHLPKNGHLLDGVIAIFGSLLTPYILLWQASSRTDPEHEPHQADAYAATLISGVLFFSVMVCAASVLHLKEPIDMTMRQAAEALSPAVGGYGKFIFALGIIGSGLVALPVLVGSMCYDVAQSLGWEYGLSSFPWHAKRFYLLISGAMIAATIANFTPINPVKALYWSMILAGILTVPTLVFILVVSNNTHIVRTKNTLWENFAIGAAAGGCAAATLLYLGRVVLHL
jgi:Mn2+/Fe2+ NRAMP family transporter